MGFQRERMAVLIVGVACAFGVYGIVMGVLEGRWIAVQVSMALLAMARFHHVERKRNFLVARPATLERMQGIKRFLGRQLAPRSLRHIGVELGVVCVSLYVVATALYFLGATNPTIVAGIGIGLALIGFEKYRTPRNRSIARSRFQ